MPNAEIEAAYRHCQGLARAHYENFPTASLLLPARVRPGIAALYAFARTADDFADEPEHAGHRLERLEEYRALLVEALAGAPRGPVFTALADAASRFELPTASFHHLLDAFCQDVSVSRYDTFAQVLDYCTRSANPVGRIVLAFHDVRDPASVAASDAVCTALQLVNFWQDVAVDLDKDRIYLPREDMARFDVTERQLFERRTTPEMRGLLALEIARTREIFARGWPLVSRTRGRLGLWLRFVWAGGHRVLDLIERDGHDTLVRRPALGPLDWAKVAAPALLGRAAPRPHVLAAGLA